MLTEFVDGYRDEFGMEPICVVLEVVAALMTRWLVASRRGSIQSRCRLAGSGPM
ncbi:MAG TPA: hypothetical protein VE196_05235 [Pseudonocardiaceae bacterium]|nr:hypothetical protein [Pseudonocardiaceae bacterium]